MSDNVLSLAAEPLVFHQADRLSSIIFIVFRKIVFSLRNLAFGFDVNGFCFAISSWKIMRKL
jgi:hypothetical protein